MACLCLQIGPVQPDAAQPSAASAQAYDDAGERAADERGLPWKPLEAVSTADSDGITGTAPADSCSTGPAQSAEPGSDAEHQPAEASTLPANGNTERAGAKAKHRSDSDRAGNHVQGRPSQQTNGWATDGRPAATLKHPKLEPDESSRMEVEDSIGHDKSED